MKKTKKTNLKDIDWNNSPLRPTCIAIPQQPENEKSHKGDGSFLGGSNGKKDNSFLRYG